MNIKYIVFLLWASAIAVGYGLKGFTKVDLSYGMSNISVEKKLILALGAIAMIVPLTLIFGRFASCKYICWQAPLMIIGKKLRDSLRLPGLRIKTVAAHCRNCSACTIKCPMNIDVMSKAASGEIADTECILCGSCIDACRFNVLSFCISKASSINSVKPKD